MQGHFLCLDEQMASGFVLNKTKLQEMVHPKGKSNI